MQEKNVLKNNLRKIAEENYKLKNGECIGDYLDSMLRHIGDPDEELRDSLIYKTFIHWIEIERYFSKKDLIQLLDTLLSDEYIFYNIGDINDDSVLRRSFSVLLINPILCVHLEDNFLDDEMIQKIKSGLMLYLDKEKDLRGYDQSKGWVHALAHAADGIDMLVNCQGIKEKDITDILFSIENKLINGCEFLYTEEDERLVNIVYYNIIEDQLIEESEIISWLENMCDRTFGIEGKIPAFKARINVKNFLRSLYFRMLHLHDYENISKTVIKCESKLNVYID